MFQPLKKSEILELDNQGRLRRAEEHDNADRKNIGSMYIDLSWAAPGRKHAIAEGIEELEAAIGCE